MNISTTNYALLYISYPIQVIGRNTRFLFVVLIGVFFSRVKKSHSHLRLGKHKIFMALVITVGVLLFNFAKEVLLMLFSSTRTQEISITLSWSGLATCF